MYLNTLFENNLLIISKYVNGSTKGQAYIQGGATFSGLQRRPENVAQLRAHIVKLCRALSEDLCRKVVTNARVRLQEVVRQNGDHIEHVFH